MLRKLAISSVFMGFLLSTSLLAEELPDCTFSENVQYYYIAHCKLSQAGVEQIGQYFSDNPAEYTLSFHAVSMDKETTTVLFNMLSAHENITYLSLWETDFEVTGLEQLAGNTNLTSLTLIRGC